MSEFRQNPANKEWVIIATERAKRPGDFVKPGTERREIPPYQEDCPFCVGNEAKTPPATFTLEEDGQWKLRVVPNKFAALQSHLSTKREGVGKFLRAEGFGIAEVVIETTVHNQTIATMEASEVQNVILAYKTRYLEISQNPGINFITIFRNHGPRAGTSLVHPHSQIIATPIIPPHVRDPIREAVLAYDTYGTCIYCDILAEELRQEERIVLETDYFVVFEPFASRTPFETRILPKTHRPSFGDISEVEIADLAEVLRQTLKKIYVGLSNPDYNYIIRSVPIGDEDAKYLHWYIVIIPKLTTPAGFEIGSGIYINVTLPEYCAQFLREIQIS